MSYVSIRVRAERRFKAHSGGLSQEARVSIRVRAERRFKDHPLQQKSTDEMNFPFSTNHLVMRAFGTNFCRVRGNISIL